MSTKRELTPREKRLIQAMERVYWNLFVFSDDVDDIQDGEHPLGGSVRRVKGYSNGLEAARLMLMGDPLIRFIKLVPEIAEGGLKPFEVRRSVTINTGKTHIDPQRGDEEFRVERRKKLEETRRRRPGE